MRRGAHYKEAIVSYQPLFILEKNTVTMRSLLVIVVVCLALAQGNTREPEDPKEPSDVSRPID